MSSTCSLQHYSCCDRPTVGSVKNLLQCFVNLLVYVISRLTIRHIYFTEGPAQNIDLVVYNLGYLTIVDGHQCAALRTGLTNVSSLCISRKYNPWVLTNHLTFMNMAQRPVVISFRTQPISGARSIGLMPWLAIEAGVQHTDIEELRITLRIGLR